MIIQSQTRVACENGYDDDAASDDDDDDNDDDDDDRDVEEHGDDDDEDFFSGCIGIDGQHYLNGELELIGC